MPITVENWGSGYPDYSITQIIVGASLKALASTTTPLASGETYESDVQGTGGAAQLVGIVASDQTFEVRVYQGNSPTALHYYSSFSSSTLDGNEVVAFIVDVIAPYCKLWIQNTSTSDMSWLNAAMYAKALG